jgi:hypothetical protein
MLRSKALRYLRFSIKASGESQDKNRSKKNSAPVSLRNNKTKGQKSYRNRLDYKPKILVLEEGPERKTGSSEGCEAVHFVQIHWDREVGEIVTAKLNLFKCC